jgi:hypothetical protein
MHVVIMTMTIMTEMMMIIVCGGIGGDVCMNVQMDVLL